MTQLSEHGLDPDAQGVLIASLDGRLESGHNGEALFNPASVTKVATTYFALVELGHGYRFTTRAGWHGRPDPESGTVAGDLIVASDGDPLFRVGEAREMAAMLKQAGVRAVRGNLMIRGPFILNMLEDELNAGSRLLKVLSKAGIRIEGGVVLESAGLRAETDQADQDVTWVVEHRSVPLRDILWHQNAYSVNVIADRLGRVLGGPAAMERFLVKQAELKPEQLYFSSNSGLESNSLSPRATVQLLRSFCVWLRLNGMTLSDFLPVAGVDEGTLRDRLGHGGTRGCVVAKSGTQVDWEEGVSSLAGVISTRDGPYLFAIFNSHGDVRAFRRWQDLLLAGLAEELGSVPALPLRRGVTDIYGSGSWIVRLDGRASAGGPQAGSLDPPNPAGERLSQNPSAADF